jgi:hypothetical protein
MTPGQIAAVAPLSEREWQSQVTQLAELAGWQWAHWRAARTNRGWKTPVSGPLGEGFPDLLLVRVRDRRLLFVELKSDAGRLAPAQTAVHDVLRAAGLEVRVWRPRDWDQVVAELHDPGGAGQRETVSPGAPPRSAVARAAGLTPSRGGYG